MICGDFNLTADHHLDTSTSKAKRAPPSLQPLLHDDDLYDTWRCQHANEHDFTFHSPRHNTCSRIDFHLLQSVSSSSIHTISWSDHATISIVVKEENLSNLSNIWRANPHILQAPDHGRYIAKHLTDSFLHNAHSVSDPSVLWCAHKAYIRGILLQLSSWVKRQRTQKLEHLLKEIKLLEVQNKTSSDTVLAHKLTTLRSELRLFFFEQSDKHFTCLKLAHYSSGNIAGKFLAQRLRKRQSQMKILHLIHPKTKSKIMNPKDIANSFADYYHSLYNLSEDHTTPQPTDSATDDFLTNLNLPTLSLRNYFPKCGNHGVLAP